MQNKGHLRFQQKSTWSFRKKSFSVVFVNSILIFLFFRVSYDLSVAPVSIRRHRGLPTPTPTSPGWPQHSYASNNLGQVCGGLYRPYNDSSRSMPNVERQHRLLEGKVPVQRNLFNIQGKFFFKFRLNLVCLKAKTFLKRYEQHKKQIFMLA